MGIGNFENFPANPLSSSSRNNPSLECSKKKGFNGSPPAPPRRSSPEAMPIRPTNPYPEHNLLGMFGLNRTNIVKTAFNFRLPPSNVATTGSSKGEDHEPNLDNLRRIKHPPSVISTAVQSRCYPTRRRSEAAGHADMRQDREGRGRGRGAIRSSSNTMENELATAGLTLDRYRKPAKWPPIRINVPESNTNASRNGDEPHSDMDIDESNTFSEKILSSPPKSAAESQAEERSKTSSKPESSGTSPFLARNAASRSTKCPGVISNLSSHEQAFILYTIDPNFPKNPFVVHPGVGAPLNRGKSTLEHTPAIPSSLYDSSPSSSVFSISPRVIPSLKRSHILYEGPPQLMAGGNALKRPFDLSEDTKGAPNRKRGKPSPKVSGYTNDTISLSSASTCTLQGLSDVLEVPPADSSGDLHRRLSPALREEGEITDGPEEQLDHEMLDRSQDISPPWRSVTPNNAPGELTAVEATLTPAFPLSASSTRPDQTEESGIAAMKPPNPIIKQESVPSCSVSPIDIDAPPLSLYDQLGLPHRTSGALRVSRPRFGQHEKAKKERWSQEVADGIRWVRGRDENTTPLIVGNIFWRPDGVSFGWTIPPEELDQRVNGREGSSSVVDGVVRSLQRDQVSVIRSPEPPQAQVSEPRVARQRSRGQDDIMANPAPPIIPGIVVKEEGSDIFLRLSESASSSSDRPDGRSALPVENSSQIGQYSSPMGVIQSHPDILSSRVHGNNTSGENSPATILSLPTNPDCEPSDALSNIATCFLDRYTRCFDRIKSRGKLSEAYIDDAIMSIQFNDLPTEGFCPRIGQPRRQSHAIVNYADREVGRNLLLNSDRDPKDRQYKWRKKSSLAIGSQSIVSRLETFEALSHTPSPSSLRAYWFTVTALKEYGLLLLEYSGELYATKSNTEVRYVSLRFHRTFLMRPNEPDAACWIDWPWVVTNDQMTLSHRPGIVCQCPP